MSPGGKRALIAGAAGVLVAGCVTVFATTQFDSSPTVKAVAPAVVGANDGQPLPIDPNGPDGRFARGLARGGIPRTLGAAATYIGVTEQALRTEIASGKTLAQVAEAHGKTADGLVSAMLAAQKKAIDASVIPQAQKDEIIASLERRLDAMVNGTRPIRPGFDRGFGPAGGGGRLGPNRDDDGEGEGDDGPGGSGTFGGGTAPGGGTGSFGGNTAPA